MTEDKTKKALKPPGFQGLLDSVINRSALDPGGSNNNHDSDDADASRLRMNRIIGSLGHCGVQKRRNKPYVPMDGLSTE